MRLLFIGSIPDHVPGSNQPLTDAHTPFFDACRELGKVAAAGDHRLLIGSASKRTADFYLCDGALAYCRQHATAHVHIERHYPDDERPDYPDPPENMHVINFPHHADQSSPHKWTVAHARAIDAADVVIAIGGGVSTRLVAHLAADRGKPVVAVACFGGSSEAVFHTMKYRYLADSRSAEHLAFLSGHWSPGVSAAHVIALASTLCDVSNASPHSYFVSYNWSNCEVADHIETLLRRENRAVLRDEANVEAGGRLSKAIEALIEESDTFISIWSGHYQSSSWCPHELEWALNLQHRQGRPSRIVLLSVDQTPPPIRITDNLRCNGTTRSERDLAIMKLIQQEQKSDKKADSPSGGSGAF